MPQPGLRPYNSFSLHWELIQISHVRLSLYMMWPLLILLASPCASLHRDHHAVATPPSVPWTCGEGFLQEPVCRLFSLGCLPSDTIQADCPHSSGLSSLSYRSFYQILFAQSLSYTGIAHYPVLFSWWPHHSLKLFYCFLLFFTPLSRI